MIRSSPMIARAWASSSSQKKALVVIHRLSWRYPAAPLRRAPGSHLRGPGATGIAVSGGRATLSAAALGRFLAENDGRVLVDTAGARHVLVLGAAGDELWLLGEDSQAGDPLPGGATVAAISGRPPGVRVADAEGGEGEESPLPYRTRPGGSP